MLTKALAILAISSSWALAQPQGDRRPPSEHHQSGEQHPDQAPPQSTEALRKRLLQTLEFAKRIVEKHEAAIQQLDEGNDPREVMRTLRTPESKQAMREARRMQGQGQGNQPVQNQKPTQPSLSSQDLVKVREFITNNLQGIDAQLKQIESMSPQASERLVGQLSPKIIEILSLREENPAMASLKLDELKAGLLYVDASRNYRALLRSSSPDQSEIDQAKQKVEIAANARFDAQVQIKQYEIHQLTTRIEQLHNALEELNNQRGEQVQAQVLSASRSPGQRFNRKPGRRPSDKEAQQAKPADN